MPGVAQHGDRMPEEASLTPLRVRGPLGDLFKPGMDARARGPHLPKRRALIEAAPTAGRHERLDLVVSDVLLALAMEDRDAPVHEVDLDSLAVAAGAKDPNTVATALARLSRVRVRYDLLGKDGDPVWKGLSQWPFITTDVSEIGGLRRVRWSYPEPLAALVLAPKPYAWIELAVIRTMRSLHGVRLYELLAIRAGYSPDRGAIRYRTWRATRDVLYQLLGLPETVPWGRFAADVLAPALDDVALTQSFTVRHDIEKTPGRGGGRVVAVTFHVDPTHDDIRLLQTPRLADTAVFGGDGQEGLAVRLRDRADLTLSIGAVAKVTNWLRRERGMADYPVSSVLEQWQVALLDALKRPADEASPRPGLHRATLLHRIAEAGADQALFDLVRTESALGWPTRDLLTPAAVGDARQAAHSRWAEENGRSAPVPTSGSPHLAEATFEHDSLVTVPVPPDASGPALIYVGPPGVSPPIKRRPDPDDPTDDGLPPTTLVVIDVDWRRVSQVPRLHARIEAAYATWTAAGRRPEATESLAAEIDRLSDVMIEREIAAMAMLEMCAVGPGRRGVRAVVRVMNSGLIERDGVVFRRGRPDRVVVRDGVFVTETDARTLIADQPGTRVVFVTA